MRFYIEGKIRVSDGDDHRCGCCRLCCSPPSNDFLEEEVYCVNAKQFIHIDEHEADDEKWLLVYEVVDGNCRSEPQCTIDNRQ